MKEKILPAIPLVFLLAAAFVLEAQIRVFGISPNLTVLFAYAIGLRQGAKRGLLSGAGLGVLSDSITGNILGPDLLGKSTAGYLSSFLKRGLFTWTPLLGFFGVFFLTTCDGIISYTSTAIFSRPPTALSGAAVIIFWQAAFNSIFGLFIKPDEN